MVKRLPDWLLRVKETLPGWIDSVSHPDGPGRFRFATSAYEPYDLDSSRMLHHIVQVTGREGEGRLAPEYKRAWLRYLTDLQRPEDGLLIDARMEAHVIYDDRASREEKLAGVRRWTSRNGLMSILEMGGRPRYPLRGSEILATPAAVEARLESLSWCRPWSAGSNAGSAILFQRINSLAGDPQAGENLAAGVAWLLKRQDPRTGAWHDGSDIPVHHLINGIFKIWYPLAPLAGLPIQYPEQVIDLCIRGLRESPALTGAPDACSIFDVALVLDTALHVCDHRRDEAAKLAAAQLPGLAAMLRPDGAFSYGPNGSLARHGGLILAPVADQSDAVGTGLCVHAISLLCNLCGLRDELGWSPITEWGMGLQ